MWSNLERIVLSYPRIQDRLKDRPEDKIKILKNIKEIRAEYSKSFITKTAGFLDMTMSKLYDGINFEASEGQDLNELAKDNCIVLVPNHQSHADYLALNFAILKKYDIPVYIAGGLNLNIFPIGQIFRKCGCFFIRRSFHADVAYKLALEAYLYYLLLEGKPIEFFFEGGRSRSGKLLPPRFGLFTMLVEAHSHISPKLKKPLKFVPVSIAHEYVPEQKALAREVRGGKKEKESTGQLLKLYKIFSYQMGTIHIKMGWPIETPNIPDIHDRETVKRVTQGLAFDCFRQVGKNMVVTPSSLIALVMMDQPEGAMRWADIKGRARMIIGFCHQFGIAYTESLAEETFDETIDRAMDLMIGNRKIDIIGRGTRGNTFYAIKPEARIETLYFKNTILHHFLVPWIINQAWLALFTGKITDVQGLKRLFIEQRNQLKHEFYLPTIKELFYQGLRLISDAVGRKVTTLEECMQLSHKELYQLATHLGMFSRSCSYIFEGYYIAAHTIKALFIENKNRPFKIDGYIKKARDVYEVERSIGRVIKFPESYSVPVMRSALKYFLHQNVVLNEAGQYSVKDVEKLDAMIRGFEQDLLDQLKFNLRFTES